MPAPVSQGIYAPGLVNGTTVFAIIAAVLTILGPLIFARETPNITKGESIRLTLIVVWTSCTCMWLFWAWTYMHQMVPLAFPIHKNPAME